MATKYNMASTVRMRPEVKEIVDTLQDSLGVRSFRALNETMLAAFIATNTFMLPEAIRQIEDQIDFYNGKVEQYSAEYENADEARKEELDTLIKSRDAILSKLFQDVKDLEELVVIFADVEKKAEQVLPVPFLKAIDMKTDSFIPGELTTYKAKKRPGYRNSLIASGLIKGE